MRYCAFWVALVGAAAIGMKALTGFEDPFLPERAVDFVLALITAAVVWLLPNKPA